MQFKILIATIGLFTLCSCGKNEYKFSTANSPEEETSSNALPGEYRAVLQTINAKEASTNAFGTARVKINNETLVVEVNLQNSPSRVVHIQSIHAGSTCPSQISDTNGDRYVDIMEGMKHFGKILIPLDADLKTQADGENDFPISDGSGYYTYSSTTPLSPLISDLHTADGNLQDYIIKLHKSEPLNLGQRTIVILGVSSRTQLPDSVATIHDQTNEATLPIACGALVKIPNEDIVHR